MTTLDVNSKDRTMDSQQIKENLSDMATLSHSRTPQAALDRINRLEDVLHKIAYWMDTDTEILDTMSHDARVDHIRQHKMILDALHS